jgi:hypothetical protein
MSRQQENFKQLAKKIETKAKLNDGIYRDVLLGVADALDALGRHQQVVDDWARGAEVRR